MSNSLLDRWINIKLGDVLELKYGKSLPAKTRDGEGYPVYGSNGVVGQHSLPLVSTKGVIVGRKGSYGEVQLSLEPFFPIDTTYFIDELFEQPLKYWFYQLKNLPLTQLNRSTAIPGLNREDAYSQEIKLPPLAEQKVIAEKLDKLLAKVDCIKARLDAVPDTLKRFRQSVLAAAVSGKLTEEWRGDNAPPWKKCVLEDLIVTSANGLSKRSGKEGKDITVLRLADFKNAIRVEGNERKIKLNDKEQEKYSLNEGDILVIRVNGSVDLAGRFIEYKFKQNSESFCDHFIRLRLDSSKVLPTFLTFIANEGDGRHYLQANLSTSAGQNTINQGTVKGLEVFLPDVIEQKQIICRVEKLFAYADKVEIEVNAAQERVNKLTQSILAKAFRGELTAKWREQHPELISGENSAEALLASIQKERKVEREKLKLKKKTRTKKKSKEG